MSWPRGDAAFRRIVETSRFLFVILGADMTVAYASPVCSDLLGYTPDEMIGWDGLDLLHPDDRDVAAGALMQLVAEADGRLGVGIPLAARIRTRDGSYRTFEIGAQVELDDPDVAGVILRLRPIEGQAFLDEALHQLVTGADLEPVLELLARAVGAEVSPAEASVSYDWDGVRFRRSMSTGLGPELTGTCEPGDGPEVPWAVALRTGEPVAMTRADLPSVVAEAARQAGFAACWAVPAAMTHADRAACLLVWRTDADPPWMSHLVALERVAGLVALTFRHRHDEALLVRAALHDSLTGLANRTQFFQRLEAVIVRADDAPAAVLYLDLDDFKPVNDELGHAAGDEVLCVVAERIRASVRPRDLVARLGGDEFAVLCTGRTDEAAVVAIAERLVQHLAEPITAAGTRVRVAVSVGVAFAGRGGSSDALVERADRALRVAKNAGKGRWHLTS